MSYCTYIETTNRWRVDMTKAQKNLQLIAEALKLPTISEDFNKRLNAAAKAGELDAIRKINGEA
jgi:hypothetical protein